DWENEHDEFVQNFHKVCEESPTADELPKFWNDTGGLSFLWQTDDLGCGVTVDDGGEKETLQKLVLDETFEDPAILDISRKVSYQQLNEDSFQHLRNAPAYPTAPTDIFDRTRDIWSIDGSYEIGYGSGKTSTASDCNMKSKNVIDILRSLNVYPPPSVKTVSIPPEASTENYLSRKVATESQTREVGTELFSKASQSSRNLQNIVPVSQHKLYPSPVFSSGNRVCQSQAVQNSLSVHSVGTCSSSQILLKRMWSIFTVTATSAFSTSAVMLSGPAALPLLICLLVMLISSIVGGPTSVGRFVGVASMLGGFSGAGRFKSSLKCSTHLFRCW
ncbi:unnamed protein product, partial [Schistosoma mattheei]